jgi:hypothetical protein
MVTGRQGSALLMAGVLAIAGLAQTGAGQAALRSLGLLKSPSYTALSFREPQSLPSHLSARRSDVPVSFSIGNVSDSERAYHWSIGLSSDVPSQQVADGNVRVTAGSTVGVSRTVMAKCTGKRLHLVVRLADPAESIGFWAAC